MSELTRAAEAPRTLLVGCGRVGSLLGERLAARGGEVIGLRRNAHDLPAGITGLSVDLLEQPERPLPDVDEMVITLTPSIGGASNPNGYVTALENLGRALPSTPARTVFVSSTGVFESRDRGRALTEADDPEPVTRRGLTLLAGESRARELFGAVVVRPAGIYGPSRGRLLRQVIDREPVQYGKRTNRIHETDLVSALDALLESSAPPALLHAVDERPAPLGDVVTFIARELGIEPPPRIEPEEVSGAIYDGSLLRTLLGALRYPGYDDGYREIIAGLPPSRLR